MLEMERTGTQALIEHAKHASLSADVGTALTRIGTLRETLQRCAEIVVERLDGALARIWTLNARENVLELQASAGMYTHLDGPHGRVPVGTFKIGTIAEERKAHVTNQVASDRGVGDEEWARREGMVAFAGYPLLIEDEIVGVLAMFARHPLSEADFGALAAVANGISLGIARSRAMDALRASEAEQRRRADELERVAARLARSNQELDAFAYAASHDLRAPLRGIANLAQWIEEDLQGSLHDETREMLALMRNRMHRMEGLIDGILQYARAGRTHEPPVTVDVGDLVRDVVDLLSPAAATVIVDSDLPAVVTEKVPLQQVFQNLIGNAIKHPGPGVEIRITAEDEGEFWRFGVADNGPGIPAEFHDRIWAIFQTLEARDKVEGTGVGLSLVKKLVEVQGGEVALDSAPGEGARFTFTWRKSALREAV
jgi:signal transduction histidine kinase